MSTSGPATRRRPDAFALDTLLADLERVRRQLGVTRWTLLGHSWGGVRRRDPQFASVAPVEIKRLSLKAYMYDRERSRDLDIWISPVASSLGRYGRDRKGERSSRGPPIAHDSGRGGGSDSDATAEQRHARAERDRRCRIVAGGRTSAAGTHAVLPYDDRPRAVVRADLRLAVARLLMG
jgi:pimeloyl-ACP methyl ester carboxylesterase